MKRIFLPLVFVSIIASLLLVNCQKEVSYSGTGFPTLLTVKTVNTTVQGQVFDETGSAMAGAQVSIGAATATSDKYGFFRFENVAVNQNGGLVKVTKAGYFTGSRSLFYSTAATNFLSVQLIPKVLAGTINVTTGGSVAVGAASVTLPANGIVKAAASTPYSGTVNVYAAFLDPTNANTLRQMPGNLYGIQNDNTLATLATYGMLCVELESTTGEKLQLATGSEATLKMPVGNATAPATVPLWYFEEATGFWIEEGAATKTGSEYIGKVKHFSYWNCDMPYIGVDFEAKIVDQDDKPVKNASVSIKLADGTYTGGHGYTDSLGVVRGKLPKDKALILEIHNNACNTPQHSQNIGPFASSTNLGTIKITTSSKWIEITGTILDCSNKPVTNGYAVLMLNNQAYRERTSATGAFTLRFNNCSQATSATLVPIDITANQEGSPVSVSLASTTVNAGTLTACGNTIQNFLTYSIDGTSYSFTSPPDSLTTRYENSNTTIWGTNTFGNTFKYVTVSFTGGNNTTDPHLLKKFEASTIDTAKFTNIPVSITTYSTTIVEGSFTGTVTDKNNVSHTIICTFKTRRF